MLPSHRISFLLLRNCFCITDSVGLIFTSAAVQVNGSSRCSALLRARAKVSVAEFPHKVWLCMQVCHLCVRCAWGRSGFALEKKRSKGVSSVSSVSVLRYCSFLHAGTGGAAACAGIFARWEYSHVPSTHRCVNTHLWSQAKNGVLVSK